MYDDEREARVTKEFIKAHDGHAVEAGRVAAGLILGLVLASFGSGRGVSRRDS